MQGKKNRIRTAAITVCLSAALVLSGCATSEAVSAGKSMSEILTAVKYDLFGADDQNCQRLELTLPVRSGFSPVSGRTAYSSLKDQTMKEAYEKIEDSVWQISPERAANGCFELKYTRLPSSLEYEDIYIVKEAVMADHPEAFWVMGNYEIRNNFHDGNYLVLYSKYSAAEIKDMFAEISSSAASILASIPDGASELERELIIHDALVDQISYDFEAAQEDDSSHNAFSIYGALVKKKSVCTGYACAAKLLLNLVGIECRTVVGMSKNTGHMWNQVRIDGEWYNLDVTWDDSAIDSNVLYSRYNYFNVNDERFCINHNVGKSYSEMETEYSDGNVYVTSELYNFDLESCTSTKANYFEMNALHLRSLDDDSAELIIDKFISSSQTGNEIIYILFDESIRSEEAEIWLSKNNGNKYSALGRAISASNKAGKGGRIRNCSLVRMSSGEDDIWTNLYAVRLIYG